VLLVILWIGVSTPLVIIGSYYGFKKEAIAVPVRTNQIARHIPEQVGSLVQYVFNLMY
jgi:transmembrane 9 superfamily member 2/4